LAAPAGLVGSIQAIIGGAAVQSSVTLIAHATAKSLAAVKIKAAAILALILVTVGAAVAVKAIGVSSSSTATTQPSAPAAPTTAPPIAAVSATAPSSAVATDADPDATELMSLAFVTQTEFAQKLRALGTPVPSEGSGYEVVLCDMDGFTEVMRNAIAASAMAEINGAYWRNFTSAGSSNRPLATEIGFDDRNLAYPAVWPQRPGQAWVRGQQSIDLRYQSARLMINIGDGQIVSRTPATMKFKGSLHINAVDIPAGQCLLAIAHTDGPADTALWQVVAWQCVASSQPIIERLHDLTHDQQWFANGGLPWALAEAQEGIAWDAANGGVFQQTYPSDAAFTKSTSAGLKMTIKAVGKSIEHPFRWWTPDGKPCPSPMTGVADQQDGKVCVGVWGHMAAADPSSPASDYIQIAHMPIGATTLTMRAVSGDWKPAGTIQLNKTVKIGGVNYVLAKDQTTGPERTGLDCRFDVPTSDATEAGIWAVDHHGVEHWRQYISAFPFHEDGPAQSGDNQYLHFDLAAADVDHFVIKTRPWTTVRFTGIAPQPTMAEPPAIARPATAPSAIADGSPEMAIRHLADALDAGDAKTIHTIAITSFPWMSGAIDSFARFTAACHQLRLAANERFNPRDVTFVFRPFPMLLGTDQIRAVRFESHGDTATMIGTDATRNIFFPPLTRIKGDWKVPLNMPVNPGQVAGHAAILDRWASALDQVRQDLIAGKFADAYAMRDAMIAAGVGEMSGLATPPAAPTTQPATTKPNPAIRG
jgi:hypothetical protein